MECKVRGGGGGREGGGEGEGKEEGGEVRQCWGQDGDEEGGKGWRGKGRGREGDKMVIGREGGEEAPPQPG